MKRSLLTSCALLAAPCFIAASVSAAESKIEVGGILGLGVMNNSSAKLTLSENAAAACSAQGSTLNCGPAAGGSFLSLGSGFFESIFGIHYTMANGMKGAFDFSVGFFDNKEMAVAKRFYIKSDLGPVNLTTGRQDHIFHKVSAIADNILMAEATTNAGTFSNSQGNGFVLNTGKVLGPVMVEAGLFAQDNQGYKDASKNPIPVYELSGKVEMNNFTAAAAVAMESRNVAGTTDQAKLSMYNLMLGAKIAMLDARLTYTMGDPLYKTGLTNQATYSKSAKDGLSGLNLWVGATIDKFTASVFLGTETANLKKALHPANLAGENKDFVESAQTISLMAGYTMNDLNWFVELSQNTRTIDSQKINNDSFLALGVYTEFKA